MLTASPPAGAEENAIDDTIYYLSMCSCVGSVGSFSSLPPSPFPSCSVSVRCLMSSSWTELWLPRPEPLPDCLRGDDSIPCLWSSSSQCGFVYALLSAMSNVVWITCKISVALATVPLAMAIFMHIYTIASFAGSMCAPFAMPWPHMHGCVICMPLTLLPESEGPCALPAVCVHVAVCGPSLHDRRDHWLPCAKWAGFSPALLQAVDYIVWCSSAGYVLHALELMQWLHVL